MRIEHHHYVHLDPLVIVEYAESSDGGALAVLTTAINELRKDIATMSGQQNQLDQAIASLQAEVTAETDADVAAEKLVSSIPTLIQQAVSQALAAGASQVQLQALSDLATTIQTNRTGLAAAVTANTPAAGP